MNHIATNISALRKAQKLTQKELAKRAGMSNDYVSKIEKGQCLNVGILYLLKLAEVLKTTLWELCGDPNEMVPLKPFCFRCRRRDELEPKVTDYFLKMFEAHRDLSTEYFKFIRI